ncbi:hypothetical protein Tco_0183593 [Tanacetum coccineum]
MDPQDLLGSFLLAGLGVSLSRAVGFLRGTSAVVVILVKGHAFPTIVKVRPVDPLGCDPLALVDSFTPIEDNIGLLKTRFDEEVVFVLVFSEDVTGLVNLTLLSLFFEVTTTNLSLELLMLGQVTDIAQKDKNEAKRTKLSTGMKEYKKSKPKANLS